MNELPKQYIPQDHEERIYQTWEDSGAFRPSTDALKQGRPPFVIMLPLPNITGSLHMGHALQHSMMDVLIRYHRMLGEPVLWQPGTDHAGIATQNVVEKELRKEGTTRHDLGREKFLERVWQWQEQYGNTIVRQMQRLGSSCDWSRSVFTMDPAYVAAVHEAFVRYYERGYIYRGNRIVNWCPRCASVISDLEIKHEARDTTLYTLRYPLLEGDRFIEVATTRPETMLGDTAVAVHATDARYQALVGQQVRLPLTNRVIPIIADERVDASFGTGAVKVTPAHDHLDAQLAATHHLEALNVIGEDGRLTDAAGTFAGQDMAQARASVLAALQTDGALVKSEPYRHEIALCDRCGTVIEPLLSRQWFVDMSRLKDETIQVAEDELVQFFPSRWKRHFLEWMTNVHDWTISRQLWWGQSIPVWWKPGVRGTERENEPGSFVVSVEKPEGLPAVLSAVAGAKAEASGEGWEADPDVLDTWFSSALWPFATLGWPEATSDLKTFYPTSVLVTARDIVYLWVARMIFSGLELLKGDTYGARDQARRIPFHHVFIYPTVLTKTGQRMSKSLGTGVDPLELIETYGADATRFGLLHQLNYDTQALKFDEAAIKASRNFANKIWNLARLLATLPEAGEPTVADAWMTRQLQQTTAVVTQLINEYKLGEAARTLHDFIWNDFADWYMEIVKIEGSPTHAREIFTHILQLLHPFMPHLTEVLWAHHGQPGLLITSPWPHVDALASHDESHETPALEYFKAIVSTVRSARVLLGIAPGATITLAVDNPPLPHPLAALTRAELVPQAMPDMKRFPLPTGTTIALGGATITTAAVASARGRLDKELAQCERLIATLQQTLAQMEGKAPQERIAAKEAELQRAKARRDELQRSRELLQ